MYLIDSYAWVEYFRGTEAGKKVIQYIENGITPSIVIAELSEKYRRENLNFDLDLNFIISKTKILALDLKIAKKAGEINAAMKKQKKGWGMADSIVLASAIMFSLKIITGDEHFRGLKEAIMIK